MISTQDEYDQAVRQLKAAAAAYYAGDDPILSDAEFDALMFGVQEVSHKPWATSRVTELVAAGAVTGDVPHTIPMLSLDNVFSIEDYEAWLERSGYPSIVIEPKIDGLALAIRYTNGKPVQAVLRGDGLKGEDVTYALPHIANLPATCGTFSGEVRGEAVFTREQSNYANELREANGDKPFTNPRNGVAGTLRGARDRSYSIPFSFYAYDVYASTGLDTHIDRMEHLSGGIPTAMSLTRRLILDHKNELRGQTMTDWITFIGEHRDELPVDIDGVVVKANRDEDRERLGESNRAPRWAVAYKFPAQEATSVLRTIHWQVGRTGVITPRAEIDPVFVSGTTITYATLHNPDDLARKGFMLGDVVIVKRAGEVIPRLEEPLVARRDGTQQPVVPPTSCPRCGSDIDRSQSRWRCVRGRNCGLTEWLAYAVSRDALDIEGLGKTQIGNLVDSGAFIDPASIFEVGSSVNVLVADGQVAPANATKIANRIEEAKKAPLSRVLTALGIVGTGRSLSRSLASHFGSMDALLEADVDALADVEKIGPVKAAAIADQLDDLASIIERMAAAGVLACKHGYSEDDEPEDTSLAGMTVVVTGTMTGKLSGLSRNDMNDLISRRGGKPSGSVSKATSMLVVGQTAGSKLAKAQSLGVRVVTEEQFAEMVGAL